LFKTSVLQGQEVTFAGLDSREQPTVNPFFSTLKHSKAVDKSIKSPANVFVRALLVLDTWTERTVCCIS